MPVSLRLAKSASILKTVPLEKGFFARRNVLFINSASKIYTVSGHNIDYIFPPIITPLVISSKYFENSYSFCSYKTVADQNCINSLAS